MPAKNPRTNLTLPADLDAVITDLARLQGTAIEKHAKKNGFSVVRDLCGHGVGIEFHEEPDVEHFGKKGTGMLLVPGMVFTIEPMTNMGTWEVFIDEEDGWTVVTEDEQPSAQWEHTFVMTDNGLEILTH